MNTKFEDDFRVELPGIPVSSRSYAERAIRQLVAPIASIANGLQLTLLLKTVRITNCYQEDVNRLQESRVGLSGYAARRPHVQGIARTCLLPSENGELAFAVVIDVEQLGPCSLNNPRCLITVNHELLHVLFETNRINTLGYDEYLAEETTRELR